MNLIKCLDIALIYLINVLKTDNCENIDTINGVICVDSSEIEILHCYNESNNQIKPKEFYKGQYQIGRNTKIQELCEGELILIIIWVYQSLRNTFDDSPDYCSKITSSVPDSYSQST